MEVQSLHRLRMFFVRECGETLRGRLCLEPSHTRIPMKDFERLNVVSELPSIRVAYLRKN